MRQPPPRHGLQQRAEFALQMIRFPYRQVFGDPSQGTPGNILDVFRPTLSVAQLKTKFLKAIE